MNVGKTLFAQIMEFVPWTVAVSNLDPIHLGPSC